MSPRYEPEDVGGLRAKHVAWRPTPALYCVAEQFPLDIAQRASDSSLSPRTTEDSVGPNSRILAMRKYTRWPSRGCRPSVSRAARPVSDCSGRAGAATAIDVEQSDRRSLTTADGDLLFLSHGYLGAFVHRRA